MNTNCQWTPPAGAGRQVFSGSINEASVGTFTQDLLTWMSKNAQPGTLVVYLNSSGGNVHDALAMRAAIGLVRRAGHKVVLVLLGRAASCANIVAQGADEVYIDENAWVMTHNVRSQADGDKGDLEAEAAFVRRLEEQALRLIATPQWKPAAVTERVKNDRVVWLSAKECFELGLVNGILAEPSIAVRKSE
jgi:ATP-dependent protease ClpP protease subunit